MLRLLILAKVLIISQACKGQTQNDFSNCLLQIIQIEAFQELFFSIEDQYTKDSILCIEGTYLDFKGVQDSLYTDRNFFERNFNNPVIKNEFFRKKSNRTKVYVESSAFIESFEVPYWMQIDSLNIVNNEFLIYLKTTSSTELDKYRYISGRFAFREINEKWILIGKEIQNDNYLNPYVFLHPDSVRVHNQRMIDEAKNNMKKH
jgi:hypothetical protein